jgi:N utilization substance protein B
MITLMALFHYEVNERLSPAESFNLFLQNFTPSLDEDNILGCTDTAFNLSLPFIRELYFGVTGHQQELDRFLNSASEHWRVDRMSRVDRNIMRMALFELLFIEDIPPKVSINEAIDLGKHYGAEDSGSFINGILDHIHQSIEKGEIKHPLEKGTG